MSDRSPLSARSLARGPAAALLLFACAADTSGPGKPAADPADDSGRSTDSGRPTDSGGTTDSGGADSADPTSPCPPYMVLLSDAVCIDIAEASLEESLDGEWVAASPYLTVDGREVRAVVAWETVPQGYISGDEAEAACAASGKRLCTSEEWLSACRGPDDWLYPYGAEHLEGACNDAYAGGHPVVDYFGTSEGVWDTEHMNDPGINQQDGTVDSGGEHAGCVGPVGAWDLHGNLHEWVADSEGTFRGGFYADGSINGPGCTYSTTAHSRDYHDYSTGFRCCADAATP